MKGSDDKFYVTLSRTFLAQRVGDYVVAYPSIAQVFLRLERVHVCVDVLVLHYIFSRNILDNLIHAFLRFWCKKRNDLKMVFQTWLYWYYYLQRCVISMEQENIFKWKHYQPDIILLTVRWYLRYNLSLRDLVEMMEERGLFLAHTTIMRWVHQYGPELNERIRKHLKSTNDSWRVDETYIKIKGEKMYLYRAIDSGGNTIDFI